MALEVAGSNRSLAPFLPTIDGENGGFGRAVKSEESCNIKKQMTTCGRGGIGRRAGFRYQWRKSWGFESLRPHHLTAKIFAAFAAQVQEMPIV